MSQSSIAAAPTHRELRVQRIGSLVFVTPLDGATGEPLPAAESPSLTVELSHGAVGLASFDAPAGMMASSSSSKPLNAWAILGCGRLLQGLALCVATSAELAGTLRGHPVFRATKFEVLAPEEVSHPDDERYIRLLRKSVDESSTGGGLYFSYGADLTLTTQALAELASKKNDGKDASSSSPVPPTLFSRADPKVWWNRALCEPLLSSEMGKSAGLAPFVVPFICGSFGQAGPFEVSMAAAAAKGASDASSSSSSSSPPSPDALVTLTLIARRATSRPGVRHWRRGADAEGAVANFVETEQIAEVVRLTKSNTSAADASTSSATSAAPAKLSRDPLPSVASFVQVRGSIPLLWSQVPELTYKPPTKVAPATASGAAFSKHARSLTERYGDVLALNLANAHGSEGLLGEAYASLASGERERNPKSLKLVQFDFHAVCGATRYERLEELWPSLSSDVEKVHSFYFAPGEGKGIASPTPLKQRGVVRTNCVDCLDRTNVVQGWLARKALLAALRAVCGGDNSSSSSSTTSLAEAAGSAQLESAFKTLWADHGDGVSRQYAGTGALKSGFTRTGKRGLGGLADDGFKSLARYYLNNFRDGEKQDALDYATGAFSPSKSRASPFAGGTQPSPALPLLVAAAALVYGLGGVAGIGGAVAAAVASVQQQHEQQQQARNGGGENSSSSVAAAAAAPAVALVSAGASVVVKRVVMPLAAAGALLLGVKRNGKNLVNKPRLLPEAAAPW